MPLYWPHCVLGVGIACVSGPALRGHRLSLRAEEIYMSYTLFDQSITL